MKHYDLIFTVMAFLGLMVLAWLFGSTRPVLSSETPNYDAVQLMTGCISLSAAVFIAFWAGPWVERKQYLFALIASGSLAVGGMFFVASFEPLGSVRIWYAGLLFLSLVCAAPAQVPEPGTQGSMKPMLVPILRMAGYGALTVLIGIVGAIPKHARCALGASLLATHAFVQKRTAAMGAALRRFTAWTERVNRESGAITYITTNHQ